MSKVVNNSYTEDLREKCCQLFKKGIIRYENITERDKAKLAIAFLKEQDNDDIWDILIGILDELPQIIIAMMETQMAKNAEDMKEKIEKISQVWRKRLMQYTETMVSEIFEEEYSYFQYDREE